MRKDFTMYDSRKEIAEIGNKNKKLAEADRRKFRVGKIFISSGCRGKGIDESNNELAGQFSRYINGDWGDIPDEDTEINNSCVDNGYGDVLGVYTVSGTEVWICTQLEEEVVTAIILPEEY